jgi:hypothetical protein
MDKILLLLIGLLLVFMFISFNQQFKFVENRANNNIDKQEDFNANGGTYQYDTPTSCPVCSELKGGVCQPKSCPFGKSCALTSFKKKQQAGNCYYM